MKDEGGRMNRKEERKKEQKGLKRSNGTRGRQDAGYFRLHPSSFRLSFVSLCEESHHVE